MFGHELCILNELCLLTANSNSRIPEMKKAVAVKVPPTTILCKGFFNKLNLQRHLNVDYQLQD